MTESLSMDSYCVPTLDVTLGHLTSVDGQVRKPRAKGCGDRAQLPDRDRSAVSHSRTVLRAEHRGHREDTVLLPCVFSAECGGTPGNAIKNVFKLLDAQSNLSTVS